MAIRTILQYPDPRLRRKAAPVTSITPEVLRLLDDMAETMYAAPGVGLAAPQIGEDRRIFVIDVAGEDQPSDLREFINPEIIHTEGSEVGPEGCLSFPGISEEIRRATKVTVAAMDRHGNRFELTAEGLLAIAIQHEHDHLEGILMIDHLGVLRKRIVHRKMQKRAAGSEAASA